MIASGSFQFASEIRRTPGTIWALVIKMLELGRGMDLSSNDDEQALDGPTTLGLQLC